MWQGNRVNGITALIYSIEIVLEPGVTCHYVIDQSMISISDMKKIEWGEPKQNPGDFT